MLVWLRYRFRVEEERDRRQKAEQGRINSLRFAQGFNPRVQQITFPNGDECDVSADEDDRSCDEGAAHDHVTVARTITFCNDSARQMIAQRWAWREERTARKQFEKAERLRAEHRERASMRRVEMAESRRQKARDVAARRAVRYSEAEEARRHI
jgi:hypothetical protein